MADNTERLRVAHILSGRSVWGTENYVYNLAKELRAQSIEMHVICANEGMISSKFAGAGFSVDVVPMRGYTDIDAVKMIYNLLRVKKIQVLHTHLGLDSFLGVIAAHLAKVPVVMSVHFDHPSYANSNFALRTSWASVQKLKNHQITHFLPITQNVANELSKREAVPKEKITVVHPGIPPLEADYSRRLILRNELEAAASDIVLISLGRLQPEKNFPYLLESISAITKQLNNVKLWIVGDGLDRGSLHQAVASRGLSSIVKLLGYRPDAIDLLSAADVFVLPSKKEPFGMAAVEAMFVKLPVIGTHGPGLSTIIENDRTGLLVDPEIVQTMTDAIVRLCADSALRKQFGEAGRDRALANFSSEIMAGKIAAIYEKVLTKSPP